MALRRAYRSMHRRTGSTLAPYGITADQFVVLSLLHEQDGITQKEISLRASSDPNTIRAVLLLMETNGLLVRSRHGSDGRALIVTLTRTGRETYERLAEAIESLQKSLTVLFTGKEVGLLIQALQRIDSAFV